MDQIIWVAIVVIIVMCILYVIYKSMSGNVAMYQMTRLVIKINSRTSVPSPTVDGIDANGSIVLMDLSDVTVENNVITFTYNLPRAMYMRDITIRTKDNEFMGATVTAYNYEYPVYETRIANMRGIWSFERNNWGTQLL